MSALSVVSASPSNAVWDKLSTENAIQLHVLVHQFQATQERMTRDLFVLTQTLVQIKELTGENFYAFAEQNMGLKSRTTIRRYMHIHTVLEAHFLSNGRIDPKEMKNFTQRAFELLGPDTDEDLIVELRTIAQSGNSVDEKTVKRLLEVHGTDHKSQIASLEAEVKTTKQDAVASQSRLEIENARLITQEQNTQELVRRLTDQRTALDIEMEELRKQQIQVQYIDKEVVPPGYISVEEAIEAVTVKKNELEQSLEPLRVRKEELEERLKFISAGADEFLRMKDQVDGFLLKFPVAMIRAVSSSDPAIKQHIEGLSVCMMQFATQLQKAVA
jgi:hypothetical protein